MGKSRKQYSKRRRRHKMMQEGARERILDLYRMANERAAGDPDLAQHYIDLARKLAMATKISLPRDLKRRICHHCKHFLTPGHNVRYRINRKPNYGSYLAVTCLDCGHIARYIFKGSACRQAPKEGAPGQEVEA